MKVNVTPSTGMCSPARSLAEAVAHSRRALAIEPGDADAHNLGVVLARQGQLDEVVQQCWGASNINPGAPDAHNNLGSALALARQGHLGGAVPH